VFDAHFFAFAGIAALLVISPGATMVVVADAAIDAGRRAGLWTVAGVGTANGSLAVASAFGLSALFHRFPQVLHVVAMAGAAYLAWLGARAMVRAMRPRHRSRGPQRRSTPTRLPRWGPRGGRASGPAEDRRSHREQDEHRSGDPARGGSNKATATIQSGIAARFGRGLITNYSNPSGVLFYTVVVPQFITPPETFLQRYLLLGATHVAMSVVWLCAFAISVGTLAEHMTRPGVRRAMDMLTGLALLAFAVKLIAS